MNGHRKAGCLGGLALALMLPIGAFAMEEGSIQECQVGVVIYSFEDEFINLYREELYGELLKRGFLEENIRIVDSQDSAALQMRQLDAFIEDGVDVLIVNAVIPSLSTTITDRAVEAGIPLIYFNREPPLSEQERWEESSMPVTYVGADERQAGILQGEIIGGLGLERVDLNENGKVDYCLIQGETSSTLTRERTAYCVQELEDEGFLVNCLYEGKGDLGRQQGQEVMEKALRHHGKDIEVVFCGNDTMALGALAALDEAGRCVGEDIFLVGVDAIPEALKELENGRLTGTVVNDYFSQAQAVADAAAYYVLGEGNEHYIGCDYLRVGELEVSREKYQDFGKE